MSTYQVAVCHRIDATDADGGTVWVQRPHEFLSLEETEIQRFSSYSKAVKCGEAFSLLFSYTLRITWRAQVS